MRDNWTDTQNDVIAEYLQLMVRADKAAHWGVHFVVSLVSLQSERAVNIIYYHLVKACTPFYL